MGRLRWRERVLELCQRGINAIGRYGQGVHLAMFFDSFRFSRVLLCLESGPRRYSAVVGKRYVYMIADFPRLCTVRP